MSATFPIILIQHVPIAPLVSLQSVASLGLRVPSVPYSWIIAPHPVGSMQAGCTVLRVLAR